MWQIKILNSYLDFWSFCEILRAAFVTCWSVEGSFSAKFLTISSSRRRFHRRVTSSELHINIFDLETTNASCFLWAEIIRNSSWERFKKKKASCIPPVWSCSVPEILKQRRRDLNSFCGEEDDEDEDDQHDHTDYDHHFNVFPPVFPGNPRGCSLEWVSLKRDN